MGTAILCSHDCFQGRFRNDAVSIATSLVRSRRKVNIPNPNFNSSACLNRRRKPSPVAAVPANNRYRNRIRSGNRSVSDKSPATTNLVMGEVKILKRGGKLRQENRKARVKSEADLDLFLGSTNRLGPDPVTVKNQIRVSDYKMEGIYAGSAFVASPPPSSVPVPGFLARNGAATSDLRRLLRLDL